MIFVNRDAELSFLRRAWQEDKSRFTPSSLSREKALELSRVAEQLIVIIELNV
jgi:hypothetical protein